MKLNATYTFPKIMILGVIYFRIRITMLILNMYYDRMTRIERRYDNVFSNDIGVIVFQWPEMAALNSFICHHHWVLSPPSMEAISATSLLRWKAGTRWWSWWNLRFRPNPELKSLVLSKIRKIVILNSRLFPKIGLEAHNCTQVWIETLSFVYTI